MSDKKGNDIDKEYYSSNFFHVPELINTMAGLEIPKREYPLVLNVFFCVYNLSILVVSVYFLYLQLIFFNVTITQPYKLIRHIGLLFTHLVGIGKIAVLMIKRKKLQHIKDHLQAREYQYEGIGNFHPKLIFENDKKVTKVVSWFIVSMYSGAGMSAHISATIEMHNTMESKYFTENVTCYDYMSYYFLIPFKTNTKIQCQGALTLMNLSLLFFAWYIGTLDVTFVALLNCMKSQLIILCQAITTIRQRCLRKLKLPEDLEFLHDTENPELEKELYSELTRCTQHLNVLLQARDDIESLFTYITLSQSLASLFIFASCLFLVSTIPVNSPQFFSLMEYFLAVLAQLSVYCWFGNQITIASESIGFALYKSDWLSSSLRFKKSIILTMCRMQRPVYISIGKFTPLTLNTLLNVLRGSFSYFTVLKSMD